MVPADVKRLEEILIASIAEDSHHAKKEMTRSLPRICHGCACAKTTGQGKKKDNESTKPSGSGM